MLLKSICIYQDDKETLKTKAKTEQDNSWYCMVICTEMWVV